VAPRLPAAVRAPSQLKYLLRDERESIFEVERDPGERADLAGARPADVARMRAQHDAWFAEMAG
jgi:hypothetical protein